MSDFRMLACTITQVSPLQAETQSGDVITGLRLTGTTYSVGAQAVALWTPPNMPVILLIGD